MFETLARELIDDLRAYGAMSYGMDVRFLDSTAKQMVRKALEAAAGVPECVPAGLSADEIAEKDEERRLSMLLS